MQADNYGDEAVIDDWDDCRRQLAIILFLEY
jgi:hypothetical protein